MEKLKYIEIAHELNTKHHPKLMKHKLHYRGNVKSMSLISLHRDTPELGLGGIRTEQTALKKLDNLIDNPDLLILGRTTWLPKISRWL